MREFLEKLIARFWNRRATARKSANPVDRGALDLGVELIDGEPGRRRVGIPQERRPEHLALLGKTGTGKSYLIRHLAEQDVLAGRGFAFFDLHGDVAPFLYKTIAQCERALGQDLSERLIPIRPGDPEYAVGLNPLEDQNGNDRFVRIAEFAQVLKERWHLDTLGVRTEELLRNALYALAENGLTLVELAPFLGDTAFRARYVPGVTNAEVRGYFEQRYDSLSDAMRRVMAEPVLNKVSLFVSDPRFRHLLGQRHSTFSPVEALDNNCWIIVDLDKGRLGEQASVFGSLFLTKLKHAFFARRGRGLFTLYLDEVQNLVAFGGGLDTMLAEIRKRSGSVTTANQFLAQLPQDIQAAILSVGSLGFFQLSGADAQQAAGILDGGKTLAERLKNLPRRHLVAKVVDDRPREAVVSEIKEPKVDPSDLYRRSVARWARPRREIEEEIQNRRMVERRANPEVLDAWE